MGNRIDQLFKNKLGEHVTPPSADAWAKVQAGLSKKNSVVIYWRVAAVFAVMGLLLTALYFFRGSLSTENTPQQLTQAGKPEVPVNADNKEAQIENAIETQEADVAGIAKTVTKSSVKRKSFQTEPNEEIITGDQVATQVPDEKLSDNIETGLQTAEVIRQVKTEKPIVIEFTLPAVTKTESIAMANEETEKSSGFRKFLETARDVKNGDAEFGNGLRDIKNELLAFDFKKEKTKRN